MVQPIKPCNPGSFLYPPPAATQPFYDKLF